MVLLLSGVVWAADTPDYARESRWAAQVEDGLFEGEAVWLEANKHPFLSIVTESETPTRQAVILIHGLGVHPDWPQVIQPLRVALAERGFHTLSIQMPVLDNTFDAPAYVPLLADADKRIQASIKYLKQQDWAPTALIGHSLGSTMASHYLANHRHPFKRFVGIGMPARVTQYLSRVEIATGFVRH